MLGTAGFVSADAEADLLLAAAAEGAGSAEELLARRVGGEPLAWVVGAVRFCGVRVRVEPGVFVPRPQTEVLAARAVELLPRHGVAVDLCTGSGAVAVVLRRARPRATVVATDDDPVAIACARSNGVDARLGDLDEPIPPALGGRVDVVTAVVPYVPSEELHLLPRDVLAHERAHAIDGGPRGLRMLDRASRAAARWLTPGGTVLLELGGDQADEVSRILEAVGFGEIHVHADADDDDRAIEARWRGAG